MRNLLSSHDRVVTVFNTDDGHSVFIRNSTTANLSQKTIYDGLGIKHDPLKIFLKVGIQVRIQTQILKVAGTIGSPDFVRMAGAAKLTDRPFLKLQVQA